MLSYVFYLHFHTLNSKTKLVCSSYWICFSSMTKHLRRFQSQKNLLRPLKRCYLQVRCTQLLIDHCHSSGHLFHRRLLPRFLLDNRFFSNWTSRPDYGKVMDLIWGTLEAIVLLICCRTSRCHCQMEFLCKNHFLKVLVFLTAILWQN